MQLEYKPHSYAVRYQPTLSFLPQSASEENVPRREDRVECGGLPLKETRSDSVMGRDLV